MSLQTVVTWVAVIGGFLLLIRPLGNYMARVFTFQRTVLDRPFGWLEGMIFRIVGVKRDDVMSAKSYAFAFLLTNFVMMIGAYIVLRAQSLWPLNPQHLASLNPLLAFNTAASFTTNTNWQAYAGENTMSYWSQMAVLGFLMFTTPATGGAAGIAFLRALSGKPLGNFFVDLTLMVTRVFLPLAVIVTLLLVWQGVPENFQPYLHAVSVSGQHQLIPQGPIASQESIEHLGNNGGGYTNANSANPLENPTPLSNVIEVLSMGILPVAFFYTFGVMTGRRRFAWTLVSVAGAIFLIMLAVIYFPQMAGNPIVNALGARAGHGNMVGQELRFGQGGTSIFEAATMAFTTGSVASAHDSYVPLSSLSFFIGMMLNMVFGGKGVGLLNMLMFVIITIFLLGLMVGRTPEFLGKKIETREVSLASIAFLLHPLLILVGSALAVATPAGMQGVFNPGPQGFSEILYGFTSAAANNGSAFGGLGASQPFYEVALGLVVIIGRYASIICMLLIGQSLLEKKAVPDSAGTLRVDTPLFGGALFGTIFIVNALTFFPVLALGPIAEQYLMMAHHLFS